MLLKVHTTIKTLTVTQHGVIIEVVPRSTFIFVTFVSSIVVTLSTFRRTSYKNDVYTFCFDNTEMIYLNSLICSVLMHIFKNMETMMRVIQYYAKMDH